MIEAALEALLGRAAVYRSVDPDFSKPFVVFTTDRENVFVQFGYVDTKNGPQLYLDCPAGGCGGSETHWANVLVLLQGRTLVHGFLEGGHPHVTTLCAGVQDAADLALRILNYFNAVVEDVETEMDQ